MFNWLKTLSGEDPGLEPILARLRRMLADGRKMFALSSNLLLGGGNPEPVREELFRTDSNINEGEQILRREVLVHATVQGAQAYATGLALVMLAREAERIGDYCKNLFDIATHRPLSKGHPHHEDLMQTRDRIAAKLDEMLVLYDSQDEPEARRFLSEIDKLLDHCDAKVSALIESRPESGDAIASALAYRHFKRIAAHAMNLVSAVVQPLDKIHYFGTNGDGPQPGED